MAEDSPLNVEETKAETTEVPMEDKEKIVEATSVKEWSHKLLGCFDNCGLCVYAFFCPCVVWAKNMEALGEGPCFLCGLCFFCNPIGFAGGVWQRGKVREAAEIPGTFKDDVIKSLFCGICSLVQVTQEMRQMGMVGRPKAQGIARQ